MLLRCCLIHKAIITVYGDTFYTWYIYVTTGLYSIFSLIFSLINRITPFKQSFLFFLHILKYLPLFLVDNMDEGNE